MYAYACGVISLVSKSAMNIRFPHFFEFMDLNSLPASLAYTMREILECGNAKPFRPYYGFAVDTICEHASRRESKNIVELGAGAAPLTRRLAPRVADSATVESSRLTIENISPCDLKPDAETYEELELAYPGLVSLIRTDSGELEEINFSNERDWPPGTMLVLSGTLHHLPYEVREKAIKAMSESADAVLIIEPLRKTLLSILFVFLSSVPAIVLPIWFINRPGRLRRFLWCWLIPVAPLMFLWDGWISCIRQWTDGEYRDRLSTMHNVLHEVNHGVFTQVVEIWRV